MTQVKGNNAIKAIEEKKPVLMISEGAKNKEQKPEISKPVETESENIERKELTLQELKNRATIIHLLDEKHTKLISKRASLDTFSIKHEKDNAQIVVTDANGEEFRSSSPKTIGQLIKFWKEEFDEAIEELEAEIKKQFAA